MVLRGPEAQSKSGYPTGNSRIDYTLEEAAAFEGYGTPETFSLQDPWRYAKYFGFATAANILPVDGEVVEDDQSI
jgi:hypothetical protein